MWARGTRGCAALNMATITLPWPLKIFLGKSLETSILFGPDTSPCRHLIILFLLENSYIWKWECHKRLNLNNKITYDKKFGIFSLNFMEFSFNLQFKSFKSYLNSNNYTKILKNIYIYRKERKKKPSFSRE